MPMASGMAHCPHCQNSRWAIVDGANVCSECGREYEPRLAHASLNGASRLDDVMAPIAVGEDYDAQTKAQPFRPRVPERKEPLVSPVPDSQPPHESGAEEAGLATIAASRDPNAAGRRRLLVIGASVILLVFL